MGRKISITISAKWLQRVEEVRKLVGKLINASLSEIAFTGNISDGLSLVASAISWQPGDELLTTYPDFPANIYPWLNLERLGVKVSHIEWKDNGSFSLDDIDKKMSPRLRLISVSSVDFSTGFHCNLRELGKFCRENGILLCVDAIQSLGIIPMDVKESGIDFLASGSHKWLQSIATTGIQYVSDDIAQRLVPSKIGWKSIVNEENRSGILSFLPGNDSEQLYQFFIKNSVIVSLRAGKIRVSLHFYNNETDIQNFFQFWTNTCQPAALESSANQ